MKKAHLKIPDFAYSKEVFDLVYDRDLDKYSTLPVPGNLDQYYTFNEYLSHADTKNGLLAALYNWVKWIMLRRKVSLLEKYQKAQTLLDLGAGTGDFLKVAERRNWNTAGVDPNTLARSNAAKKGIRLFETKEDLEDRQFSMITMWHALEHVPDLDQELQWIKKHLLPDGRLVVAVPNFNAYDAKHYKTYWAAWDVPRHLHHFSAKSIKQIFDAAGFVCIDQKPLLFDALYISIVSEQYKGNPFAFIKGCVIGLYSNLKALKSQEYSSLIYVFKLK